MATAKKKASEALAPLRSRGRPPGSTSDATRARVLRAARACFAKTGYVATTNKDIADHAGITAPAIYQYFDSKSALFAATVRDAQDELVPRFRDAAAGATSARDAFRAIIVASAELHAEDPSLAAFLSALPVELMRYEDVARVMADEPSGVVAIFDAVLERGVASGELSQADAPHAMSMFLACTMGLSLYAAAIDGQHLREAVDAFVALMEGRLFRAPTTGKRPRKV